MGRIVWKVLASASAVAASVVATKLVEGVWRSTGREVPDDPANPQDASMGEAIAFVAASTLVVAVARLVASRKAADYYAKSAGHLPQALADSQPPA